MRIIITLLFLILTFTGSRTHALDFSLDSHLLLGVAPLVQKKEVPQFAAKYQKRIISEIYGDVHNDGSTPRKFPEVTKITKLTEDETASVYSYMECLFGTDDSKVLVKDKCDELELVAALELRRYGSLDKGELKQLANLTDRYYVWYRDWIVAQGKRGTNVSTHIELLCNFEQFTNVSPTRECTTTVDSKLYEVCTNPAGSNSPQCVDLFAKHTKWRTRLYHTGNEKLRRQDTIVRNLLRCVVVRSEMFFTPRGEECAKLEKFNDPSKLSSDEKVLYDATIKDIDFYFTVLRMEYAIELHANDVDPTLIMLLNEWATRCTDGTDLVKVPMIARICDATFKAYKE